MKRCLSYSAIIDKDFESFAKGLTSIQNLMGRFFLMPIWFDISVPQWKVIRGLAKNFEIEADSHHGVQLVLQFLSLMMSYKNT